MNIYDELKDQLESEELTRMAKRLHDDYYPFLLDDQVWDLLRQNFPEDVYQQHLFPYKNEVVGHKLVNNIVMNTYFGEKKVKYHLLLKHLNRKEEVSIFELNLGSSRLDYARINRHSYAYEIKTELDSLDKLEKQVYDYSKAFEYVQIVCHPCHLKRVQQKVPSYCGIVTYNTKKEGFPFSFKQKKQLNKGIDPAFQLASLTSKELDKILKEEKVTFVPIEREDKEHAILELLTYSKINSHFKKNLKRRFQKRWDFVHSNIDLIEPIDVQSFFKLNADPYWVYYKNSSIV